MLLCIFSFTFFLQFFQQVVFAVCGAQKRVRAPVLGVAVTKRAHSRRQSLVNQWLLAAVLTAAVGPDNAFDRNSIKAQIDAEYV